MQKKTKNKMNWMSIYLNQFGVLDLDYVVRNNLALPDVVKEVFGEETLNAVKEVCLEHRDKLPMLSKDFVLGWLQKNRADFFTYFIEKPVRQEWIDAQILEIKKMLEVVKDG